MNFGVLDRLFQTGDDYIEKLDKLKAETQKNKTTTKRFKTLKRKAGDTLASRDPWRD